MNLEQAKFTLQSFRPDGSDCHDPAFAEALALAAENRELGDWLAQERAEDAAFAEALQSVKIPDALRHEILGAIEESTSQIQVDDLDADFIGALAQLQPPAGLRDNILAAMEIQQGEPQNVVEMPSTQTRKLPWIALVGSAAALLLAAFAFFSQPKSAEESPVVLTDPMLQESAQLSPEVARSAGVNYFVNSFQKGQLDLMTTNQDEVLDFLSSHPSLKPTDIPEGLQGQNSIGCKLLDIGGRPASLICFMTDTGKVVHLVTFDRDDISGDLPALADAPGTCQLCPSGLVATAQWQNDDQASFLFAPGAKPSELSRIF